MADLAADRENFCRVYAGPTALYRILSLHLMKHKTFLRRNLSYVREYSKPPKTRRRKKINTFLDHCMRQISGSDDKNESGLTCKLRVRIDEVARGRFLKGGLQKLNVAIYDALEAGLTPNERIVDEHNLDCSKPTWPEIVFKMHFSAGMLPTRHKLVFHAACESNLHSSSDGFLLEPPGSILVDSTDSSTFQASVDLFRDSDTFLEEGRYTLILLPRQDGDLQDQASITFSIVWDTVATDGMTRLAPGSSVAALRSAPPKLRTFGVPIFYDYLYHGSTRQTETRNDFCCPWCLENMTHFPALCHHLVLYHDRFFFRLEVDGSHRPHIIVSAHTGAALVMPVRDWFAHVRGRKRTILQQSDYDEFMRREFEWTSTPAPLAPEPSQAKTALRRTFYHCADYTPIKEEELDYNSEENADVEWRMTQDAKLLQEFDDVTSLEKDFMGHWNDFAKARQMRSDQGFRGICEAFVEEYGHKVAHMRHSVSLHFTNLWDFGLISGRDVVHLLDLYDTRVGKHSATEPALKKARTTS